MPTTEIIIADHLDTDTEPLQRPKGAASNIENLGIDSDGRWVSRLGTASIANDKLPLLGANTFIGGCVDEVNRWLIFFLYNDHVSGGRHINHGIYLYDEANGAFYKVFGEFLADELYFSLERPIIPHVYEGAVYFTDARGVPCKVDIAAGIKTHAPSAPFVSKFVYSSSGSDILEESYALNKVPPTAIPECTKIMGASPVNLIQNCSYQFAISYEHFDGGATTLGPWSAATKLNTTQESDQGFNAIRIFLNTVSGNVFSCFLYEVRKIRLWAKHDNFVFLVREWDREDPTQTGIFNGTSAAIHDFYGNVAGEVLDATSAARPFNDVPRASETLEIAGNRLWLGNNLHGYDSPLGTSLSVSLGASVDVNSTSVVATISALFHAGQNGTTDYAYGAYVIRNPPGRIGFFLITGTAITDIGTHTYPTLPPPPTTVSQSSLVEIGGTIIGSVHTTTPAGYGSDANTYYDVGPITLFSFTSKTLLKTGTSYKFGIVFYDKFQRKCGVVTKDSLSVSVPDRNYLFTTGYDKVEWTLGSGARPDEIPEWAHYYSIVTTQNQRTRSFVQAVANVVSYVKKDASGNYVYNVTSYTADVVALAINIKGMVNTGLGYTFTEGDQCRIITSASVIYNVAVVGLFGEWIHLRATNIGTLADPIIYEVYTPYSASNEEPFFEQAKLYAVGSPGEITRSYMTTSGYTGPDVFAITRNFNGITFIAEASCPNDNFFTRWDTNAGRINVVTDLGEVRHDTEVAFSNVYTPGTNNNGLSTFEFLNRQLLPLEIGPICSLKLATKLQGEGSVMLAIGRVHTASLYLGETQISDTSGNAALIKSTGVIGQINILKGDLGTQNPESVVEVNGNVYWIDVNRGVAVMYCENGLVIISDESTMRIRRFFQTYLGIYRSMSKGDIINLDGLNQRPLLLAGHDRKNNEILWALPKLAHDSPNLTDFQNVDPAYTDFYPDISGENQVRDPHNFCDLQSKTIVFKPSPINKWVGAFTFRNTEGLQSIGNSLYSFKNGTLYQHEASSYYNRFYEINYRSRISVVCNEGAFVRELGAIGVQSSHTPSWLHFKAEAPRAQSTDLQAKHFQSREGIWYASVPRDRMTPGAVTAESRALMRFKGRPIRSQAIQINIEFQNTGDRVWFRLVRASYNLSSGHN